MFCRWKGCIWQSKKNWDQQIQEIERVIAHYTLSTTYIRWGRRSCPDNGTELVYDGYVGGSPYTHTRSAVNYVCLPKDPTWSHYKDGLDSGGPHIYGSEYQISKGKDREFFNKDLYNQDVPCDVCKQSVPLFSWSLLVTSAMMAGRWRTRDISSVDATVMMRLLR